MLRHSNVRRTNEQSGEFAQSRSFPPQIPLYRFGLTSATLDGRPHELFRPPHPAAPRATSPGEVALLGVIDGAVSGRLSSLDQDLKILRDHTVQSGAVRRVDACADSRVPLRLIFDQTIGHIFVARVAGNVVTPEIIGSLEYGAAVLGTKVILVLGHGCGQKAASLEGGPGADPHDFRAYSPPWLRLARPEAAKSRAKIKPRIERRSRTRAFAGEADENLERIRSRHRKSFARLKRTYASRPGR